MRRRRSRTQFHEPSLVPLADMLTNTVGIMVFILIFTVLTAGGVVLVKRLPREHSTEAAPLYFVCTGGRLFHLNDDESISQFLKPLGQVTSFEAVDGWMRRFNARQVEGEFFVAKGEGEAIYSNDILTRSVRLDLTVVFLPRDAAGETEKEIEQHNSRFRQILRGYQPEARFVYFIVHPDSLDLFLKARSIAIQDMHFGYGWMPLRAGEPVRFALSRSSGGYTAAPQ
jgi:hypothetical protein